jgi:(S)-mandelate dehydrogenase
MIDDLDRLNFDLLRAIARRKLPRGIFEYIDRGGEDEVSLSHNRQAFDSLKLVPRALVDVSSRSQQVELFGRTFASPLITAPAAAIGLTWHRGEVALAHAAREANIAFCAATESIVAVEDIVATGIKPWFQLYVWNDREISWRLIDRVRDLGIDTLVVTVDAVTPPKREYNAHNGFDVPLKFSLRGAFDIAMHPGWVLTVLLPYLRRGGMPELGNYPPGYRSKITKGKVSDAVKITASFDWAGFAELRRRWKGPLIVKGILHPDDAVKAADHGAEGIVVSNHGGRDLDSAVAPIEMLPRIAEAAGTRLVVLADSGIRRGSDVVKLLASGAKAAMIGRAFLYGTAAGGEAGARAAIAMLADEIWRTMGLLGCRSLAEIGPGFIYKPRQESSP